MLYPAYINVEHPFDLRLTPVSDHKEKCEEFARTHFETNENYSGFLDFRIKEDPMKNLPANERPLKPDPKDTRPMTDDRNLAMERSSAIKRRMDIEEKISALQAERIAHPRNRSLCDQKKIEIERLQAEHDAILVPRSENLNPWMKSAVSFHASESVKWFGIFKFYKIDTYLTSNRFKVPRSYKNKDLFGFSNIVIDLDIHDRHMKPKEILGYVNRFINLAENELFRDGQTYTPNSVVFTGRGLQLWYALDPTHAKCKNMYRGVAEYLLKGIQNFIDGYKVLGPLAVDSAASLKESGLFRMPCSYNTSAGTWGDIYIRHADRINLAELYDRLLKEGLVTPKKIRIWDSVRNNFIETAERRVEALKKLVALRKKEHAQIPRDLLLFIVYSAYMTATGNCKNAMNKMLGFNKLFENPMPAKEAKSYMSTAAKIGGYKLRNATIIEWLGITEEEQDAIGLHTVKTRTPNGTGHSTKPLYLDEEILQLCEQGFNKTEIAQKAGCSPQTVKRVLDKYKKKTVKEKLHNGIVNAYINGWSVAKRLKKYGRTMSRNNLRYLAKKAERISKTRIYKKEMSAKKAAEKATKQIDKTPDIQTSEIIQTAPGENKRVVNEEYILSTRQAVA